MNYISTFSPIDWAKNTPTSSYAVGSDQPPEKWCPAYERKLYPVMDLNL